MSNIFNKTALLHVLFVFLLIPLTIDAGFIVKTLAGLYGIWMLSKRSWTFFPALMVLSSFLSNSYFLYLSIPILALYNYPELRKGKLTRFFMASLFLILMVLYFSVFRTLTSSVPFGRNYARFEIVSSIIAIPYGALIKDRIDKPILNTFILSFIILILVQVAQYVLYVKLLFFILPFVSVYLVYEYYERKSYSGMSKLIFAGSFFLFTWLIFTPSFTIIFTALHGGYIYRSIVKKNVRQFNVSVGSFLLVCLFSMTFWAISNYRDLGMANQDMFAMNEVETASDFIERGKLKLLKDRAPLWAGSLAQIIENPHIFPPKRLANIEMRNIQSGGFYDWEHHSHNVFLELIRSCGALMGGAVVLLFLLALRNARVNLLQTRINPEERLMYATSMGIFFIGSFTGVYVLSGAFALIPLSVIGYTSSLSSWNG